MWEIATACTKPRNDTNEYNTPKMDNPEKRKYYDAEKDRSTDLRF
jgi:hypothetical protein